MTQEIKIGVSGDASGGEKIVKGLDRASEDLAGNLDKVDASAARVNRRLETMGELAGRVRSAQRLLERELGRPVRQDDAETFIGNYDRMRKGRGVASRRLRAFDDFEGWYLGHTASFPRPSDAEKHRRFIIAAGMQGTQDSQQNGGPAPPQPPPPPDGGQGGAGIARRAGSMAWGVVKGGLALAGIGSVMGMATKGVSDAQTESIGIDTLKRRLGDLGVDFDHLREQSRNAAFGLGLTYVESQRLAQQYTREAGALSDAERRGVGLQNELRTGAGISRAYGLEPEQGVQFLGSMRRMGVVTDDQSSRRLALYIADAVAKGGYGGKADEVLAAISSYAQQTARVALSMPNALAYASALTSMTATGVRGLDPAGAAAILSTADESVRRGGAFGMAAQNFTYMAMARSLPGIDPVTASGLAAGGLFGTTRGVFGPHSELGEYYAAHHLHTPALNDVTNADRIIPLLMRQYGPQYGLDATKNYFGLSSIQQAAALASMRDKGVLGASARLMSASHVDLSTVSATGLAAIGRIANTSSVGQLNGVYGDLLKRQDLSPDDRQRLVAAQKGGDLEGMKEVAAKVMASKEQQETEGTKTRESIADLSKTLNLVGDKLLAPLNIARDAVSALAMHFAAGEMKRSELLAQTNPDFAAIYSTGGPYAASHLQSDLAADDKDIEAMLKRRGPHGVDVDRIAPTSSKSNSLGDYQNAVHQHVEKVVGAARDRELQSMKFFQGQGYSADEAAAITGRLMSESALMPDNLNSKGGGAGAWGIAQWRGNRLKGLLQFAKARHEDPKAMATQLAFVDYELKGPESNAARAMHAAKGRNAKYRALSSYERNEQAPSWGEGFAEGVAKLPGEAVKAAKEMVHRVEGKVTIVDKHGKPLGVARLSQVGAPAPAGAH